MWKRYSHFSRHPNGPQVDEKIPDTTNFQGNKNQNLRGMLLHFAVIKKIQDSRYW
jgi:hypothetical protein